jgi:hypothetical protein
MFHDPSPSPISSPNPAKLDFFPEEKRNQKETYQSLLDPLHPRLDLQMHILDNSFRLIDGSFLREIPKSSISFFVLVLVFAPAEKRTVEDICLPLEPAPLYTYCACPYIKKLSNTRCMRRKEKTYLLTRLVLGVFVCRFDFLEI